MATGDENVDRAREIIHEVNNALGIVINYSMFVEEELGDRPDLTDDLAEIRNAGTRSADLLRELSDLLRKQSDSSE